MGLTAKWQRKKAKAEAQAEADKRYPDGVSEEVRKEYEGC